MTNNSKSKFWLDIITKIVNLFFKSSRRTKTKTQSNNQHVVPHEKGWAVRREGNEKYTAIYKYQQDAINRAKRIAKKNESDTIIHRKDGTIRNRISHK